MTEQAIVLEGSGTEHAQRAIALANAEGIDADQAVADMRVALVLARAALLAEPTTKNGAEVVRAERRLQDAESTADRIAEAKGAHLISVEDLRVKAERVNAERDYHAAGRSASEDLDALRKEVAELQGDHDRFSGRIAVIESLVSRHAAHCHEANDAAHRAGISGLAQPINLDLLRRAVGILLAGDRPRPRQKVTAEAAQPMMTVLGELARATLSPADRAVICRAALDAFADASETTVAAWLELRYAPPACLPATAMATHQRAQRLLAALQGERKC